MPQQVKVKNDKFEPGSQTVSSASSLSFENKRDTGVKIELDPNFFDQSSLTLAKSGNQGDSGSAGIKVSSGTGWFKAPKATLASPKQEENDIKGDIVINPKK